MKYVEHSEFSMNFEPLQGTPISIIYRYYNQFTFISFLSKRWKNLKAKAITVYLPSTTSIVSVELEATVA